MTFVGCPSCGMELKPHFFESRDYAPCHVCGARLSVLGFPAMLRGVVSISATDASCDADDASCFHHEARKAIHSCTRCGKFLCHLCASDVGSDILCPECLVAGLKGGSDTRLEQERTLHDSIALALAIFPLFTVWLAGLGGAAAIYAAIRYWKYPGSLVRRYGWRRYLAILFGVGEIGGFVFAIVVLLTRTTR